MKKIKDLLDNCLLDIDILGVTDDSRRVHDGYLFVATKGFNVDHYDFIDDAIKRGAIFVIADRKIKNNFPHLIVDNINDVYVQCCQKFYDVDVKKFNFIGITGTDGKTTTTSIIKQLLDDCAYIGTNGVMIKNKSYKTNNTTPCIDELYASLKDIQKSDCLDIAMEVSSEALLHKRLEGISFDFIGYTNITEDHLNIHKTMENYCNCKFSLINYLKPEGKCFINGDCPNCKKLKGSNIYSYGFDENNDYVISNVLEKDCFVKFTIEWKDNSYEIESPLLGKYNIYNVALAFIICLNKNIDSNILIDKIKHLDIIKGRREYLYFGQNFDVILDYAHTFNGIKNILESVKKDKKIIVVTGAAGGREKEKRPLIGKFILDNADISIFTMDDPRYEKVEDIIREMVGDSKKEYLEIVNRKKAIEKAFSLADRDSVVLILGKGRDNYMAIKDKKIPYCDYDVIKELLEKR